MKALQLPKLPVFELFCSTRRTLLPRWPVTLVGARPKANLSCSSMGTRSCIQLLSDPRFPHSLIPLVAVVCGERIERFPHQSLYNRVFDLDWNGPPGPADYCGGDALFRRQVLEESGGYDDTLLAGEEPELCTRLRLKGWTVLHLALSMTTHDLAMTRFSQYWRRSSAYRLCLCRGIRALQGFSPALME